MNYFIDFEATQFSEEIISVGCIREDSENFYSLVAPVKGKITPFITNLTGITAEALENAMSPDTVFELMYDWAFSNNDEIVNFYSWGDSDITFCRNTFKRTSSLKARIMLGYICGSLKDFSKEFRKKIDRKQDSFSLLKAIQIFEPEATQNHNSLDDAVMLKKVYDNVMAMAPENLKIKVDAIYPVAIVTKKKQIPSKWAGAGFASGMILIVTKKDTVVQSFENLDAATDWVMNTLIHPNQKEQVKADRIKRKILNACNTGNRYIEKKWVIVK